MGFARFFKINLTFFLTLLLSSNYALAVNGIKLTGVTARDAALGGASSASAKDSSVMVSNPAGLSKLDKGYDFALLLGFPDADFRSSGMLSNSQAQGSSIDFIGAFSAGAKIAEFALNDIPVSAGFGLYSIAGLESKFDKSRTNAYLLGDNFDRQITLRHMRMPLALSAKLSDKLYAGVAFNIGFNAFRTDMTTSSFTRTSGNNHWDFSTGFGYTLGLLYDINDSLSLGLSYESETWMNEFDDYKDVLPKLDIPPTFNLALSYDLNESLELNFEYTFIEYTRSTYFKRMPAQGGFGWRDQHVYALGIEYLLNDMFTLRTGYNYSKSPIRGDALFANGLAPLVTEHHLSLGTAIALNESTSLDLTYTHSFKNSVTDDGSGDVYSSGGKDSKGTLSIDCVWLGFTNKF